MSRRNTFTSYKVPAQLTSIEHTIFVGSLIPEKVDINSKKPISIYGIDLSSRKICPSKDLLYSYLSEIFKHDFSSEDLIDSEIIIPNSLVKKLTSDDFQQEILMKSNELVDIWISISVYETIEYINQLLNKITSTKANNDLAYPFISRLIQNFSTAQLWNISYKANQRACEYILSNKIDLEEYPVFLLEHLFEKGLLYAEKGWKPLPFKRWGNMCRQSEFSKYFFNTILGIGEDGFIKRPSLDLIVNSTY